MGRPKSKRADWIAGKVAALQLGENFKVKSASASPARTIAQLRRRYTRVVRHGECYAAYLQIDQQGFCVVEDTTKERANWFRNNLAIALERLLSEKLSKTILK